ncbi:MAG TPA: glycosyltransferase [Thermoleophilaceae bacterium]|jgi:glycosyltransferase involved in cell wall biosynthesis|nr:glycosyltransferase [Thermoleophilaceae bacterium]
MPEVILPVLDEAEALPWVLGRMPGGFDPLVVDNGSSDGSGAIAAALGARVVEEPATGFGAACWAGLAAAGSELVCFMDCDGSLDPRDLPGLVEAVATGRMDLALGARTPEPGAWPWHARLANRALAAELRRRTSAPLTDLGPMRVARRLALLDLGIRDRRFGWPLEMVIRAAREGWAVGELPVPYLRRVGGRSKVSGSVRGTARALRDMAAVLA